eukprot:s200_g9.t1
MVFGIKVILAAGLRGYKEEAMVHGIKVILVVVGFKSGQQKETMVDGIKVILVVGSKGSVGKETMVFGIKVILVEGFRCQQKETIVDGIKVILVVGFKDSGTEETVAYAVGLPDYVHGFYDWLEATWETSGREVVSKDSVVRLLGLELSVPFLKEWATEEIPAHADRSPALVKEAQQRSVKTTLADMGIIPEVAELRVDATAAIAVASSGGSWRTRHLRLRENWLVELVNSEEYQLMHQPGVDQLADVLTGLTKQLASDRAWKLLESWGFFKGCVPIEVKKLEIADDEVKFQAAAASTAQATAASTAQATSASAAQATAPAVISQVLNGGTLSRCRCTQVLMGLGLLAGVTGEEAEDHQAYTGVSSEHELWIADDYDKLCLGVEQASGLSKGEGKELLTLLGIDERSVEQEARLTALIAKYQDNDKGAARR